MAQEFSHPARSEMPEISGPNSFGVESLHKLAKDSFNAVAHMGQEAWIRLFFVFGRFVGSQEIQSVGKALVSRNCGLPKHSRPPLAILLLHIRCRTDEPELEHNPQELLAAAIKMMSRALGVHPFVAEKTTQQATHFSIEALEQIYRRLLKVVEKVKTDQITLELAMDTLVAELAAR